MAKTIYAYPGTFCLAHYGHERVAKEAQQTTDEITIVCSENEEKNDRWFTPEECKKAWQFYDLGEKVKIMTFAEFMETYIPGQEIVMIRGIRGEKDLEFEKRILQQNYARYGIKKYFYIIANEEFKDFSSTKARKLAMDGNKEELVKIVHPEVAKMMIAKAKEKKEEV